MLRAVKIDLGAFGIASPSDRDDHVLLGDEILHRHVPIEGHDLGSAIVTVLVNDLGKLLTDDGALSLR